MPGVDPRSGPVRAAFVGRGVERAWSVPSRPVGTLDPVWVEHREGGDPDDLLARVRAAEPGVIVVFDPQHVPAGLLAEVDAVAVAVLPDPVELVWGAHDVWAANERFLDAAVEQSGGRDALVPRFAAADYARIIATDPHVQRIAPDLDVWRSPVLPVDDALFADDRPPERPPRPLFLGESTERREEYLVGAKHFYELSHYAFGLAGDRLRDALARTTVGVTLYPAWAAVFPPRALLHLAAGHLLVTQPLVPTRGLEPGLDHLQIEAPDQLMRILDQLAQRPGAYERVRIRGRRRAESFRASATWHRWLGDLADDLRAFGR